MAENRRGVHAEIEGIGPRTFMLRHDGARSDGVVPTGFWQPGAFNVAPSGYGSADYRVTQPSSCASSVMTVRTSINCSAVMVGT